MTDEQRSDVIASERICSTCGAGHTCKEPRSAVSERIALRPDSKGQLDDVVVKGVTMFRAEIMDTNAMWMCCYLGGGSDRIAFWVRGKRLSYSVTEYPTNPAINYEPGSLLR